MSGSNKKLDPVARRGIWRFGNLPFVILTALLLASCKQSTPTSLETLNKLVLAKDTAALEKLLVGPKPALNPFSVLKTGGAYGVGTLGWKVLEGKVPGTGAPMFVITTPLTSEDVGEIVLVKEGEGLRYLPEEDPLGVLPVRHEFDLRIDPQTSQLSATDKLSLKKVEGAGSWFLFRMSPNYRVSKITGAKGEPITYSQTGGVVALSTPAETDFKIDIRYSATVNLRDYAGSIDKEEAQLTNDYWYPMIARWPAPYTAEVTAPSKWTVVGQGVRLGTTQMGPTAVTKFRMDLPCVYYSLSAGPYQTGGKKTGSIPIQNFSASIPVNKLNDLGELYQPVLEFYSNNLGKYPFEKYGALISPRYGGGALEAYSFCTWGSYPGEDAHEPAHTWFGGILNNRYLKSYWNESFAVFCDGLANRNMPIGNVKERRLAYSVTPRVGDLFKRIAIADAGASSGPAASATGYGKGAFVLGMLEQILGTETMIKTLRTWVETHPKGTPAEWEDYEKVAQSVSGKNLEPFFKDWLHTPGYAEFKVDSVGQSGGKVSGHLTFQSKVTHFPLEVLLQGEGKERTVLLQVEPNQPDGSYRFEIDAPAKVSKVVIDPYNLCVRPIGRDEAYDRLSQSARSFKRYQDRRAPEYLSNFGPKPTETSIPSDLNGLFIVGHPDHVPVMKDLCTRAGFVVQGNTLTYDGTKIDLRKGCALALVPLGGGKFCAIGLGTTKEPPKLGDTDLFVGDAYGRFLRGKTRPKDSGPLVFKLD